ncbi:Cerato-platanin [Cubamyces lactineus]|nr:Cerato-platanin [Cubamyces lactineus]
MQFSSFTALIVAAAALATSTSATKVTWDAVYDVRNADLSTVSCSDGKNGLITKGYTTFGSLPDFPYIGGAAAVTGWNSTGCATCWKLTYKDKSIEILAIDHADEGFNIAQEAMLELAGADGVTAGVIDADVIKLTNIQCGIQDY